MVGYALSPIDLIPDFIPVLGYLDDLILIPLGIMLVIRLVPADVLAECRHQAEGSIKRATPVGRSRPRSSLPSGSSGVLIGWLVIRMVHDP